jgi:hypothetical protein
MLRSNIINRGEQEHKNTLKSSLGTTDWYTDNQMTVLLEHYLDKNKSVTWLTPMLATDWTRGNDLKENLIEYQKNRINLLTKGLALNNKVLIPINLDNRHWALLYFIYGDDCITPDIYFFDPLGKEPPDVVVKLLNDIYSEKIKVINIGSRVQQDSYNCGPWIIEAAKSIARDGSVPDASFNIAFAREQHAKDLFDGQPVVQAEQSKDVVWANFDEVTSASFEFAYVPDVKKTFSKNPLKPTTKIESPKKLSKETEAYQTEDPGLNRVEYIVEELALLVGCLPMGLADVDSPPKSAIDGKLPPVFLCYPGPEEPAFVAAKEFLEAYREKHKITPLYAFNWVGLEQTTLINKKRRGEQWEVEQVHCARFDSPRVTEEIIKVPNKKFFFLVSVKDEPKGEELFFNLFFSQWNLFSSVIKGLNILAVEEKKQEIETIDLIIIMADTLQAYNSIVVGDSSDKIAQEKERYRAIGAKWLDSSNFIEHAVNQSLNNKVKVKVSFKLWDNLLNEAKQYRFNEFHKALYERYNEKEEFKKEQVPPQNILWRSINLKANLKKAREQKKEKKQNEKKKKSLVEALKDYRYQLTGFYYPDHMLKIDQPDYRDMQNWLVKCYQHNLDPTIEPLQFDINDIGKKPIFIGKPKQQKKLVKREELLDTIAGLFKKNNIVCCYGGNGIGKSSLAFSYCEEDDKLGGLHSYPIKIWMNVVDPLKTFKSIGQWLQLINLNDSEKIIEDKVKTWLSTHPRTLLIFDFNELNVTDQHVKKIEDYIPDNCHVFLVSRTKFNNLSKKSNFMHMSVGFSPNQSDQYFKDNLIRWDATQSADLLKIAQDVNYSPLALQGVITYLKDKNLSPKEYLKSKSKLTKSPITDFVLTQRINAADYCIQYLEEKVTNTRWISKWNLPANKLPDGALDYVAGYYNEYREWLALSLYRLLGIDTPSVIIIDKSSTTGAVIDVQDSHIKILYRAIANVHQHEDDFLELYLKFSQSESDYFKIGLPNGDLIPLKGFGASLAIADFLFDLDYVGRSDSSIRYTIESDIDGKLYAKTIKVNARKALIFLGEDENYNTNRRTNALLEYKKLTGADQKEYRETVKRIVLLWQQIEIYIRGLVCSDGITDSQADLFLKELQLRKKVFLVELKIDQHLIDEKQKLQKIFQLNMEKKLRSDGKEEYPLSEDKMIIQDHKKKLELLNHLQLLHKAASHSNEAKESIESGDARDMLIFQAPIVTEHFTERKIIELVIKTLQEKRIVNIYGIGGVGKTTLAAYLVNLALKKQSYTGVDLAYDKIIWIYAEHNIDNQFQQLAKNWFNIEGLSAKETFAVINEKLAKENVLIVLDSAEKSNIYSIRSNFRSENYHILITSYLPECQDILGFELGKFNFNEGEEFVKKQLPDAKSEEISTLLETVDNLPLALEHAVAYVQATPCLLAKYPEEFKRHQLSFNGTSTQAGSSQTVMTTFLLTFKSLLPAHPAIGAIVKVCAYLAPENIISDLVNTVLVKPIKSGYTLALTSSISTKNSPKKNVFYIKINNSYASSAASAVATDMAHDDDNLLEYTVRDSFGEIQQKIITKKQLLNIMEESEFIDFEQALRSKNLKEVEPFLSFLLKIASSSGHIQMGDDEEANPLAIYSEDDIKAGIQKLQQHALLKIDKNNNLTMHRIVQQVIQSWLENENTDFHLGLHIWFLVKAIKSKYDRKMSVSVSCGRYQKALLPHLKILIKHIELWVPRLKGFEKRREDLLVDIAKIFFNLGDSLEAEIYYKKALAIRQSYCSELHPKTLVILNNLALVYGDLGKIKEQHSLLKKISHAASFEQKLVNSNNLAVVYSKLGDIHIQRALLEETLWKEKYYYGPDHWQIATTLNNLAVAYGELGDEKKGLSLFEQAQQILKDNDDEDHRKMADIQHNIAIAYGKLGDVSRQCNMLEQALANEEEHYGKNHWQTATIISNLAVAYGELGKNKKERTLLKRALKIEKDHYGADHWEIATTLHNLAMAYGKSGYAEKQCYLLEQVLKIEEKHYDLYHWQTATTLHNLVIVYDELNLEQKQRDLLSRLLEIKHNPYNPNNWQIATTLHYVADAYGKLGYIEKQRDLLKRVLSIQKFNPSELCYQKAITLNNLALTHGRLGNVHLQYDLLIQALGIEENYYGKHSWETVTTLGNLAFACIEKADSTKEQHLLKYARSLLKKSLRIEEQYYSEHHWKTADTLYQLAMVYGKLGNLRKQHALLRNVLRIKDPYGKNCKLVATIPGHLADIYSQWGKTNKQRILLEQVVKIEKERYGENSLQIIAALSNLAFVYGELGNTKEQYDLLIQVYIIEWCECHSESIYVTGEVLNNLAFVYGELGDKIQQQNLLERALQIDKSYHGENSLEVAATLSNLAFLHGELDNVRKERVLLRQALKIEEYYYGQGDRQTADTLHHLAMAYGKLGNLKKQYALLKIVLKIEHSHYKRDDRKIAIALYHLAMIEGKWGKTYAQGKLLEMVLKLEESCYDENHLESVLTLRSLVINNDNYPALQYEFLEKLLKIQEKHYGECHPERVRIIRQLIVICDKLDYLSFDKSILLEKLCKISKLKDLSEKAILLLQAWCTSRSETEVADFSFGETFVPPFYNGFGNKIENDLSSSELKATNPTSFLLSHSIFERKSQETHEKSSSKPDIMKLIADSILKR